MKWLKRTLGATGCAIAVVVGFALWALQPWADQRPMRTWAFALGRGS